MPEHAVLNKAWPQEKWINQSLTNPSEKNTQLQLALVIAAYLLKTGKLRRTWDVLSPEAQAHEKSKT